MKYKRASLACAARLADTVCPQSSRTGAWEYLSNGRLLSNSLLKHVVHLRLFMNSELEKEIKSHYKNLIIHWFSFEPMNFNHK